MFVMSGPSPNAPRHVACGVAAAAPQARPHMGRGRSGSGGDFCAMLSDVWGWGALLCVRKVHMSGRLGYRDVWRQADGWGRGYISND